MPSSPKQDWKSLRHLDEDLVKFLRKKYPPIEYNPDVSSEEFLRQSMYRAGQRDVIVEIERIIQLQKKTGGIG
jgi:Tfp pilus assembly protein FimV